MIHDLNDDYADEVERARISELVQRAIAQRQKVSAVASSANEPALSEQRFDLPEILYHEDDPRAKRHKLITDAIRSVVTREPEPLSWEEPQELISLDGKEVIGTLKKKKKKTPERYGFRSRRLSERDQRHRLAEAADHFIRDFRDALEAIQDGRSSYAVSAQDEFEIEFSCMVYNLKERQELYPHAREIVRVTSEIRANNSISRLDIQSFQAAADKIARSFNVANVFIEVDASYQDMMPVGQFIRNRDALVQTQVTRLTDIATRASQLSMLGDWLLSTQDDLHRHGKTIDKSSKCRAMIPSGQKPDPEALKNVIYFAF